MRIVITGGPGYGKSSLIEELKRRGFNTKEEVAREIITREKKRTGKLIQIKDRFNFQKKVLREQIKQFKDAKGLTFFDRGIPDGMAYLIFSGIKPPKEFADAIKRYRYDFVFFVEKLPHHENDGIREDAVSAAKVHKILKKVYRDAGYKIICLPPVNIEKRADLVLSHLKIMKKAKTL